MKKHFAFLLGGALLGAISSSQAAIFANFSGLGSGDPLDGYDGWTQSEANPAVDSPIAYGQAVDSVAGAAVGGWFATPEADSFYSQHTVALPFADSTLTMTFTVGRDALVDPTVQNSFEIGAYNSGGTNLFSFVLGSSIDPDIWNMYYRTGAGSNILLTSTRAVDIDQITTMTLGFSVNGSNTDFDMSLVSGTLETLNFNGTLTGLTSESFDNLRVSMLKVPGTDPMEDPFDAYGTNYIAFNGVEVVPEPSSWMVLGLTAGALLVRRRRA